MLALVAILHRLRPKDLPNLRKFAQENLQVRRSEQAHRWLLKMWGMVRARSQSCACRPNRLLIGLGNLTGWPLARVPQECIQNCRRVHGRNVTGRSSFHGSYGLSYSGRSRFLRRWCDKELVLLRSCSDYRCQCSRCLFDRFSAAVQLLSRMLLDELFPNFGMVRKEVEDMEEELSESDPDYWTNIKYFLNITLT